MPSKSEFRVALNWTAFYVLAVIAGLWFRQDLGSLGNYWWGTIIYFVFTLMLLKV